MMEWCVPKSCRDRCARALGMREEWRACLRLAHQRDSRRAPLSPAQAEGRREVGGLADRSSPSASSWSHPFNSPLSVVVARPASRTSTRSSGRRDSRSATTQPLTPAPMMTTSYFSFRRYRRRTAVSPQPAQANTSSDARGTFQFRRGLSAAGRPCMAPARVQTLQRMRVRLGSGPAKVLVEESSCSLNMFG